jgi:hypothetical protein
MNYSARQRPVAAGVIIIVKNVDDYTTNIFDKITYPTLVLASIGPYVDGSEPFIPLINENGPTSCLGLNVDNDMPQLFYINVDYEPSSNYP